MSRSTPRSVSWDKLMPPGTLPKKSRPPKGSTGTTSVSVPASRARPAISTAIRSALR